MELNPRNRSPVVVCAAGCCEGAVAIIVILVISRTLQPHQSIGAFRAEQHKHPNSGSWNQTWNHPGNTLRNSYSGLPSGTPRKRRKSAYFLTYFKAAMSQPAFFKAASYSAMSALLGSFSELRYLNRCESNALILWAMQKSRIDAVTLSCQNTLIACSSPV
jgi:hypothetical protein